MTVKDVTVAQNDRFDFEFNAKKKNGVAYTLPTGAKWFFVVKNHPKGAVLKRITQTAKEFTWNRVNLNVGHYVYEIGIRFADGTKTTIVPNEMKGEIHPSFDVGIALEGATDG